MCFCNDVNFSIFFFFIYSFVCLSLSSLMLRHDDIYTKFRVAYEQCISYFFLQIKSSTTNTR